MRLIKATHKNIDEIVNIEMSSGYHKNPVESDFKKLFVNFFNSTHPYAFILKDKNKSIGYFAFRKVMDNYGGGYLAITKKYQGNGLGKLLLNKLISLGKKLRFRNIKISVNHYNKRAIGLYKKYGFKIIGKNKNKLIMEKKLQ